MLHEHKWGPDGDCDAALMIGGRVIACHARRCVAPGCTAKRTPPGDFCLQHIALGRRLRLPARSGNA